MYKITVKCDKRSLHITTGVMQQYRTYPTRVQKGGASSDLPKFDVPLFISTAFLDKNRKNVPDDKTCS